MAAPHLERSSGGDPSLDFLSPKATSINQLLPQDNVASASPAAFTTAYFAT